MRPVVRIAALAAVLLAAGCSSYNPLKWVGIMTDPANPPTPLAPIDAKVAPRAAWTASVGKSAGLNLRPAVAGGRVYAASAEGTITVVAEDDGHVLSRVETKKPIGGGLEVSDGRIIAGTLKGEVLAYDTSGKALWTASVAGEVIAPAAVSRNVVVVRTADGRIFAFAAADGKRLWVYQRPTPALLLRSPAGVLALGGDVVAGYPNGKLIALDIEDGKLTWEETVALPKGATELERIADVAGLPVIDGPNVCAAADQLKVGCFEIATRNVVWSRELSTSRALATDAKNLYLVDETGAIHALDKKTGASVWKNDKLLYRRLTAPAVFDGKVVVGDVEGFLHVLSADDGAIVGRLPTDGTQVVSLVPGLSALFAQTAGGALVAVRF
ncbi:MAG TPA: outer membrane protein assembly factor BamB [Usitatibacter sp.]|nr:outer membrane protein assembly factor BamB [Usitatibacter sp.]